MQSNNSRLKTFYKEHGKNAIVLTVLVIIFIVAIIVIAITSEADVNDGIKGTDSSAFEKSAKEDQEALKQYKIASYLPITSASPSYTISYSFDRDEQNNQTFKLILNAFTASARDACIKRLLAEDFRGEDPLSYDIEIENYYNPFLDIDFNNLPENLTKKNYHNLDASDYAVQTFTHTLYDGNTNTYRVVYKNGQPETKPQLLFTYSDLPFLDKETVRLINSLD